MECFNCGNEQAYGWRVYFSKEGRKEECNLCSTASFNVHLPDVYWNGPGYHPGILDKKNQPIFLSTRRQKARIMRENNIREAGDFLHGSRGTEFEKSNKIKQEREIKHKQDVKEAGKIFREGMRRIKV